MKKMLPNPHKRTLSSIKKGKGSYSEIISGKNPEDSVMSEQAALYQSKKKNAPILKAQSAIPHKIIYGQILEINTDAITLRCLIDENEGLFQKRRFDRLFFEGAVNLQINQLVEVKIYTKQGEVKFRFANSNRQDLVDRFTPKDYFSQFDGSILFQPLPQPLHIDADNF